MLNSFLVMGVNGFRDVDLLKMFTRSGVRTHEDIRPLGLKSKALTTQPSWYTEKVFMVVHVCHRRQV